MFTLLTKLEKTKLHSFALRLSFFEEKERRNENCLDYDGNYGMTGLVDMTSKNVSGANRKLSHSYGRTYLGHSSCTGWFYSGYLRPSNKKTRNKSVQFFGFYLIFLFFFVIEQMYTYQLILVCRDRRERRLRVHERLVLLGL